MSLLLVLAMMLAMVPAVLAAETNLIKNEEAAPGQELTLTLPDSFKKANGIAEYWWRVGSSSYYGSSGWSVKYYTKDAAANSNEGLTNTVSVPGSITSKQEQYVYVYATAEAADANNGFGYSYGSQTLKAIYAFKITVTPWSITLAVDTTSYGFNNKLNAGGKVKLLATVSGPYSQITSEKVTFKINGSSGVAALGESGTAQTVEVQLEPASASKATAQVVLKAGSASGKVSVTASVKPKTASGSGTAVSATYPANGLIDVNGSAKYTLTLLEENIYVTKGGTTKKIQPSLKNDSTPVTGSYTYEYVDNTNQVDRNVSPSGMKIVVNSDGSITPQVEETDTPVVVKVTTTTVSGLDPVYCRINVVKNAATITGLTVSESTDLSTKKFAKIPANYRTGGKTKDTPNDTDAINNWITETVGLEATIQSENEMAANRLVWSSSDKKIATVEADETDKGKATVTAVAPGKVVITATMPSATGSSTSKSIELYVWTTKAYTKIELPTKVSGTVNDPYATAADLGKQTLTATVGRTTVPLSATYAPTSSDGKTYKFTGTINSVNESSHTLYYPTGDKCDAVKSDVVNGVTVFTFDAGSANISTIQITGPQDASFKVNETLGNLTCTIRTTETGDFITKVVWKDKNNTVVQTDSADAGSNPKIDANRTYYVSTLNLANKITSPGEYQYYCEVTTTKNNVPTMTRSGIANVTVGGDYIISIEGLPTSVKVGDTITFTAKPKQYANGKYTDVTGSNYTVAWTVSDASVGTLNRTTGSSVSFSVKGGGKVTVSAETTIGNNKYAGTKEFTVTVPTADTVRLTLGENDSYVLLDGSKLAAAVKDVCKTTPSTFVFKSPANGTLYTTSSLSNTASTSTKYSASEVSKMAYRPTRTTGTHEIEYTAYDGSAQIATGKVLVMTSANTVEYHIAANEKQQMVVSDFQSVYGTGLSSVTFSSNTDSRGGLYKGSTTSSGKVGSESYSVSSGTNLLKNLYFIAGSTVSKYSVTIPFTATGSAGTVSGQLVVYVNDTHTLSSTGATFRSMGIAAELAPDNATGSTYITIDRVVGGKLYSSYTSIKRCTALTSKDLGSTKFYFTGSNSLDNLYVLPMADSKSVDVTYTIDGITKGTLSFKVNQQKASNQFTDVVANFSWAANSVDFMYTNDIIKGNSSTNPRIFGPRAMMTRAMLVTVLYRAAGEPTVAGITNKFTDNKQGQYYYNAVLWASNMGIVNGSTATTFEPNGNITREQIAAILYRYAGSPTVTGSLSGYPDQAQVSSFAVSAMQWAVSSGIITGVNDGSKTTLSAKGNATRAQVAVMLHRFLTFD